MDEEADRFSRLLETLDFSETYFLDVHATFYD
jgi:hypothetical protein